MFNMISKTFAIPILIFLLVPNLVLADVIMPLNHTTLEYYPLIILLEVFVFWLLKEKIFDFEVNIKKIFFIVFIANIVTSVIGLYIPIYKTFTEVIIFILISFVVSVLVEGGIYYSFLKNKDIDIFNLLLISILSNLSTYIPIAFIIIF